ncbi:MAG: HEAT repeat domain-containing protein [Gemmatimonadetes bacterium]|nr:HEAT repeat domain-containing protein [Gemmatimonadota bacterium]
MNARTVVLGAAGLGLLIVQAVRAQGGTLERRVAAVRDGRVEFDFPSRPDACGDGRGWFRVGQDAWYVRESEGAGPERAGRACETGPVRVVLQVVGREVLRIERYVGPRAHDSTATDLGAVDVREATALLLGIGRSTNGRPAREAIGVTALASDAAAVDGLAAIARDDERSREVRRAALGALLRLDGASAIPVLIAISDSRTDGWVAAEAVRVLSRSEDPRARRQLRGILTDAKRDEDLRAIAAGGLGDAQATGEDAALLREAFKGFAQERSRDALLAAVAAIGGRVNATWLLSVARDETLSSATRRRAVLMAERAGASGVDLAGAFDAAGDSSTRDALISALAQEGSRASRDKLAAIAQGTESPTLRRKAITALERFDSAETRELLTTLAMPRP